MNYAAFSTLLILELRMHQSVLYCAGRQDD